MSAMGAEESTAGRHPGASRQSKAGRNPVEPGHPGPQGYPDPGVGRGDGPCNCQLRESNEKPGG
jgi:hypothetical protein